MSMFYIKTIEYMMRVTMKEKEELCNTNDRQY